MVRQTSIPPPVVILVPTYTELLLDYYEAFAASPLIMTTAAVVLTLFLIYRRELVGTAIAIWRRFTQALEDFFRPPPAELTTKNVNVVADAVYNKFVRAGAITVPEPEPPLFGFGGGNLPAQVGSAGPNNRGPAVGAPLQPPPNGASR